MTRTTNRIPNGNHQVVARYTANANYNQADSAPVSPHHDRPRLQPRCQPQHRVR